MNPARSLPSALAFLLLNGSNEEDALQWEMQYVYLAGPFIGAFLAAVLFRYGYFGHLHKQEINNFRGLLTRGHHRLY